MDYEEVIRRKRELNKYQIVIIYCERGNSSLMLARELKELPIQVKSIAYGISGYQGPLYRDRT